MSTTTIYTYTGDGINNAWSVPFAYLKKDHVELYVNEVEDTTFTWITDSSVAASSVPADGAVVTVKRVTPRDALDTVLPNSGTFRGSDINNQSLQALYVAEEGYDALVNVLSLDTTDNAWDAESRIIKNVATPTADHHAVRKDYVDAVAGSASAAAASASAAASSASAAAGSATTASGHATVAGAARVGAEAARDDAETAETNAAASASAASASASTATTQAGIATTQASNASSSASTATTQAGIATTQAGLAATARTGAETAETNAEAAQAYAEEWAIKVEDSAVSVAAGGDGSTTFSALHWAAKAAASAAAAATFDPSNYVLKSGGAFTGNVDFGSGIDVTGNITVTGTVDGVDIAARNADLATAESKLAGIETGADVTDATNVAAAGAAMLAENETITGTWSFNNALTLGVEDTTSATLTMRGGGAGNPEGAEITLGTAADHDTTYAHYRIDVYADTLRFGRQGQTDITLDANGDVTFANDVFVNGTLDGGWTLAAEGSFAAATVGFTVTGIPSGVNEIIIHYYSVSANANGGDLQVYIGDSGGIETTGYDGHAHVLGGTGVAQNTGFSSCRYANVDAGDSITGIMRLTRDTGNTWFGQAHCKVHGSGGQHKTAAFKTLSGTLDRIEGACQDGTSSFDSGTYRVFYR